MTDQYVARGSQSFPSPAGGDSIKVLGGSGPIITNLDWSGVSDADTVEVSREYNGDIGSAGTPFKAKVSTLFLYAAQGGACYFTSNGLGTSDTTELIQIVGEGRFYLLDGPVNRVELTRGKLDVGSGASPATIRVAGGYAFIDDDASDDPTLVEMLGPGGGMMFKRGATTFTHKAGTVTISAYSNAFGTMNIESSGVKLVECGDITVLNCTSGLPDLTDLIREINVPTININMALPGANTFLANPNVIKTTVNKYMHDGRF